MSNQLSNNQQDLPSVGLFRVLSEYGLTEQVSVLDKLYQFTINDWDSFVSSLEAHFATIPLPSDSHILDPLTFCFPSLESSAINHISSHVLISAQTFIDDPILDMAYWLTTPEEEMFSAMSLSKATWKQIYQFARPKVVQEIASYIQFYIRAKDAIQSGKLIPFKDLHPQFMTIEIARALIQYIIGNRELRRTFDMRLPFLGELWIRLQQTLRGKRIILSPGLMKRPPVDLISDKKLSLFVENTTLWELQFISLMSLYTFGGLQGLSTDLTTERNFHSLRYITEFLAGINRESTDIQLPIGFSRQYLSVPLLCELPFERVIDAASQETESFQIFRASLQQQLLNVNAPVGSLERDKQIFEIQTKVNKELAGINQSYRSIQKRLRQKFSVYSLLGSFSIIIGGLAAAPQNLDAISLAGSVVAGAGIGTSIKEFAKEWFDYQKELDNLRSNPNYFLWKLKTKERKSS